MDFSVPDTFTVSGTVSASDPRNSAPVPVGLEIKITGTSQNLPCVKTVAGRTWTLANLGPTHPQITQITQIDLGQ